MKKLQIFLYVFAVFCFSAISISAQTPAIVKNELSQSEIDRIVKKFTDNEAMFRQALNEYAYDRSATIQSIGMGGQITGVYRRDSFMTFKDTGERIEKISYNPISTLQGATFTPDDIDNLGGVNPFAIEPKYISNYNFAYLGKEKIDELDLYVFDVTPKTLPNPKKSSQKFFSGRIWVDDRDLMIVKSKGKALPEGENMQGFEERFLIMETWRENIDGKYWFPAFTSANDELVFDNGHSVKLKAVVKYTKYRVGRSEVKILDDDVVIEDEAAKPAVSPTPAPKKP